uniref:Uncharacterized protein n=1 Tax=Steinernema glaseri TaxID=37863 RepID=A0A1I7YF17_9BILA
MTADLWCVIFACYFGFFEVAVELERTRLFPALLIVSGMDLEQMWVEKDTSLACRLHLSGENKTAKIIPTLKKVATAPAIETISSPQVATIPPALSNALEPVATPVAMQCGGPISSSGHALMQRSHSQDFAGGGLQPSRLATAGGAKLAPTSARGGGLLTGSRNQLAPGTGMVM